MARLEDVVKDGRAAAIQSWGVFVGFTAQARRKKLGRLPRTLRAAFRVRWVCLAILLTLIAGPFGAEGRAGAAEEPRPGGVYLSWVRGVGVVGCPDPLSMQAAISRRLGHNPFLEPPVQFLDAVLQREPATSGGAGVSAWVVVITLSDVTGQAHDVRTLRSQAPTCTSLAEAAAVAMALLIDPGFSPGVDPGFSPGVAPTESQTATPAETGAPAPSPSIPRALSSSLAPSPAPARAVPGLRALPPATSAERAWHPTGWVRLLLASGLLPRPAWGTSLGVELARGGYLAASLSAVFFPEVRTPKPDPNFAFGVTYVSAHLCASARAGVERVFGTTCAGVHAGVMHATVYFPEATSPGERSFWALSLEPGVAVRVWGPVAVAFSVAGYLLPSPRDFVILGRAPGKDVAFAQPRWAALGALSVRASW